MPGVQKVGPLALIGILVFALVFALLPSGRTDQSKTGVTLRGVRLALYPARDPEAVWTFAAREVQHDPVSGQTELSGLSDGERLLRERAGQGFTGKETLDATLRSPGLSISAQDDLSTPEATLYLADACAEVRLKGNAQEPVRIQQGQGFSAPLAEISSPTLAGRLTRLKMSFQFVLEDAGEDSDTQFFLDPKEDCVNGQRVPRAAPPGGTP